MYTKKSEPVAAQTNFSDSNIVVFGFEFPT
jgi:hypothetical protein